jgi:hypothetical protein
MLKTCIVGGCIGVYFAKGYCCAHYSRLRQYGTLQLTRKNYDWTNAKHRRAFYAIKWRAKKCNILFTLVPSDIVVPEFCPILDIPLISTTKMTDNSPTVDRLNPVLGYTKENICVVSNLANRIKNNATADQVQKVANFMKKIEENRYDRS